MTSIFLSDYYLPVTIHDRRADDGPVDRLMYIFSMKQTHHVVAIHLLRLCLFLLDRLRDTDEGRYGDTVQVSHRLY